MFMQVGVQWTGQYYSGQPQVSYVHTLAAQSEYTRQYAWQRVWGAGMHGRMAEFKAHMLDRFIGTDEGKVK